MDNSHYNNIINQPYSEKITRHVQQPGTWSH